MELSNRALLVIQFAISLVAWSAIARGLIVPALGRIDRRQALRWAIAPQMLRHVGMSLLATGVVGAGLSPRFATWVATGDLITAVLAIAAFVALGRPGRLGFVLAAAATFVGAADLIHNLILGLRYRAADHLGAAWPVVTMIVPAMLVMHAVALGQLVRRPATGTS
jgi:hypothetical protein